MKHARDFRSDSFYDAYEKALSDCAARLQGDGVDLDGYSLPERVDDLEAARRALGYGPIDLLSESAGTRTAMIYAWRHPKSIHRSVLVGVNPPGDFLWYPRAERRADRQVRRHLQARRVVQLADGRPRRDAPLGQQEHPRPLGAPADQARPRRGRRVLRPDALDGRGLADLLADDDQLVARGRGRRPERALVPRDARPARVPGRPGEGRRGRGRADRRRLCQAVLRGPARRELGHRQPRHRLPLGRRPPPGRLAGEPGREPLRAGQDVEGRDTRDQRGPRLRHPAAERPPAS